MRKREREREVRRRYNGISGISGISEFPEMHSDFAIPAVTANGEAK